VSTFYKEYVPARLFQASDNESLSPREESDLIIQYSIDGQCFYIRNRNGSIVDIVEGVENTPVIHVAIDEDHLKDVISGSYEGVFDFFTDALMSICSLRNKTLMTVKGTLRVYLKKGSGEVLPMTLIYNGAAEPSATLSLDLEDWVALHKKETTGQALFVSGRLSFTGDMHFLLRLQTLL